MEIYDSAPNAGPCSEHSVDMWFPPSRKGSMSQTERKKQESNADFAKSICLSCNVSKHCLEYSLRHEPFGTWGGLNEIERAELRAKRGISLSRDGRINLPGIGSMNANTATISKRKPSSPSVAS